MNSLRIASLLFAATVLTSGHLHAARSKEVLRAQFPATSIHQNAERLAIEVCWDNTCDYYVARRLSSENEVWDVIFLHQFFYDQHVLGESFRKKSTAHSRAVLSAYPFCLTTPLGEPRARCLVTKLAKGNGISYASVRYDEGFRCEAGGDLVAPAVVGKTKCTRDKNVQIYTRKHAP